MTRCNEDFLSGICAGASQRRPSGDEDLLILKSQAPTGSLSMTVRADGLLVVHEELSPDHPRKPLRETRRIPLKKARAILARAFRNGFLELEAWVIGAGARPEGGDVLWSIDLRARGQVKRVEVQGEMPKPFSELVRKVSALYGKPLPGP